jgi:uncharacterized membrane protein YraQ (UPF0718 family)
MVIIGLWVSFFSRKNLETIQKIKFIPQRFWSKVELHIDETWEPQMAKAETLEQRIKNMLGEHFENSNESKS